jgi:phosphoserine phosphatase
MRLSWQVYSTGEGEFVKEKRRELVSKRQVESRLHFGFNFGDLHEKARVLSKRRLIFAWPCHQYNRILLIYNDLESKWGVELIEYCNGGMKNDIIIACMDGVIENSTMKKLIVVRAVHPAWEEEHRIQGTLPLPLCDQSMRTMDEIARNLQGEEFNCVYSSGNESSGVTAKYLARQCSKKARQILSLHEPNFGLWQGLRLEEIKQRFGSAYKQWRADPTRICPPQGESISDAFRRVQSALKRLEKKNSEKTVVVVAARTVAGLIACAMTKTGLEELWDVTDQASMMRVFGAAEENKPQSVATAVQPETIARPATVKTIEDITSNLEIPKAEAYPI